jgi:Protein of unknown function (DUF2911)
MKINKLYIVVGLLIAFALFFELAAYADLADQATTITFSEPIQIPGQVLPAGTYLFKLADTNTGQNLVQIFSSDRTVVYATIETVPTERSEPTGRSTITVAQGESGQPVLLKWFYPGSLTGHEFVYSKEREKELAQDRQQTIEANQQPKASSDNSEAGN